MEKMNPGHTVFLLKFWLSLDEGDGVDRLAENLPEMERAGGRKLVATALRIFSGERDEDSLSKGLNLEESAVVGTMLKVIEDPKAIFDIMPQE